MAMNKQRRTSNINNIITYDSLGNASFVGNLGIGMNPTERLHVSGNISVNTSGQSRVISTFSGANSDGLNILIGGGGLSSVGAVGQTFLGANNTALGVQAFLANTTGYQNTALGYRSLYANTEGARNNALGINTLLSNTTGSNNIAIGFRAGFGTGSNANTTGSNNIFIGYQSVGDSPTESNRTFIGSTTTSSTWLGGNLLLGSTLTTGEMLQVTGTAKITGAVTLSSLAGTGTRLLITDASGNLSTQPTSTYITSLTGEATNSGTVVTLTNSAVIGKVLTGVNISSGVITASDSVLSAFGKLQGQINGLQGGTIYKGAWNASTNTPTITSSVGTLGNYYVVTTAGTTNINGISSWAVGDWIIFNGTVWEKIPNVDSITSVNGQTGAVVLTTANITESGNLYYTDARARAAISLTTTGSSGAATYSSGVLNIPNYTIAGLGGVTSSRTLTINGTALDLSADRSWLVGTVTSVNATVPTGFTVGSAVTSSGNITIGFASGYSLPTTASQANWDTAYTNRILTVTTTGNSGSASLISNTLNIPTYTLVGLGGMSNPFSSTIGQMIYSNSAGAPLSLAGNTTTTKKFLSQTGDGTNSAAPFWTTIAVADVTGAIGLTALTASSPLIYNNTTGAFSIQQASNLQNGFLSAADWTTFNGKQTQVSLTTTGSSGASTFNFSTGALNIPQYTLAGLGGLSNPMSALGDMIYSNGAGAPQRVAPNTTTTRKYLSMIGTGTDGAIPTWETISGGIGGSGTTNYIPKFTPNGTNIGNSLLYDAGTNIGINTATPTSVANYISLHIVGGPSGALIRFSDNTAANRGIIYGSTSETAINAVSQFNLYVDNNSTLNATSSGNVKIGGLSATAKFEVNNGSLATSGSGFMVSGGLTNGRLETYQSNTANCIHTWLDNNTYEISAGSTSGYVSGLVITGRSATLLPDRVAIYTRSTQRFQIGSTGQLSLNAYTSLGSFTGVPQGYLAFDSSGNIITSNPSGQERYFRIAFSAEIQNTWASMPSALNFFDSNRSYVTQADISTFNQVRLVVNKQGVSGATGSKIILRYQLNSGAPFTESSYSNIGVSEVSVNINTTDTILTTSWINLASGAFNDVFIALMGSGGDGTVSPVFGNIYADFRYVTQQN